MTMVRLGEDMYRRGLTLGLTMAEIFMLILFLLLLATLALHKEHEQTKRTLNDTQEKLTEVTAEYGERVLSPEEMKRLKYEKTELKQIIAENEEENTMIKRLLEESEKRREAVEKSLVNERKRLPRNIRELVGQIESLENDLNTTKEENMDSMGQLEKIREQNIKLRDQLYTIKGVDPPCWYEVVSRRGKRHEKPYYLLDVAVYDEYLRVRINQSVPLPGSAIDENDQRASTSYAEEFAKLPLEHLVAVKEKRVSLEEFQAIAEPIKRMGKNEQIRDYACVFYARIWDYTSATAKKRWQQAREKIENFFYPLLVKNNPW